MLNRFIPMCLRHSLSLYLLLQSFSILSAEDAKPIKLGSIPTGTLTYPALDNLNFREGTIECWVKFAFDPNDYLPAKNYVGMLSFLQLGTARGGFNVHFCAQAGKKEATWFCSIGPEPILHGTYIHGAKTNLFGVWQHLALIWKGRDFKTYLGGKIAGEVEHLEYPYQIWGSFGMKPIFLGDQWNQYALMVIDDLRVSNVARKPEELGVNVGELKPDSFTTLLDPFEGEFIPDGKVETKPVVIFNGTGGLPSAQCRFVEGKFGKGLSFFNTEGEKK